jgi:hypothetical protein
MLISFIFLCQMKQQQLQPIGYMTATYGLVVAIYLFIHLFIPARWPWTPRQLP